MKNIKDLEFRMYGLVMYNISPIQQGIQYGHALQEYNNKMFESDFTVDEMSAFDKWRVHDKTFILLNGGTSNEHLTSDHYGSMNQHRDWLHDAEVAHAYFEEPDLNGALSAIVFLLDERVFNHKDYPEFKTWLENKLGWEIIKEEKKRFKFSDIEKIFSDEYNQWVELIGGEKNVALKSWIKNFRLA